MSPQKIKSLLVARGIKQVEIANHLGVSVQAVHGVIVGASKSRRVSTEIARRLGQPVAKLFPRLAA